MGDRVDHAAAAFADAFVVSGRAWWTNLDVIRDAARVSRTADGASASIVGLGRMALEPNDCHGVLSSKVSNRGVRTWHSTVHRAIAAAPS